MTEKAKPPLWQKPLPIISITGERGTGKTLFGLSICPGPETLVFDTEDSSETYQDLGFTRVDMPAKMQVSHPSGYRPQDAFAWFRAAIQTVPPGKFRVGMLDVAEDVEVGLADWVWDNPLHFNHTKAQYVKMSGIYWGDVAAMWKPMLLDLASRFETFVFCLHLGKVWADSKPTSQTKPKGKPVLQDLASLSLQMERPFLPDGSRAAVPSARVLKSRLAHTVAVNGVLQIREILPPRLPEATPQAIRAYMAAGGVQSLSDAEKAPPVLLSEDQRLELRAAAAMAEAEAAKLNLERIEAERRAATTPVSATPSPAAAPAEEGQTLREALGEPEAEAAPATAPQAKHPLSPIAYGGPVTGAQITALWDEFCMLQGWDFERNRSTWNEAIQKRYGVTKLKELTDEQSAEIRDRLAGKIRELHAARGSVPPV